MKHKIKALIKSILSLSLIAAMVTSLITVNKNSSAYAATVYTRVRGDRFVSNDGGWYYYHGESKVLKYAADGSVTIETYTNADLWPDANTTLDTCSNALTKYFISDGQNLSSVYCMERAVAFGDNTVAEQGGLERLSLLPATAQEGIKLALLFGWHDGMTSPVANTNADDYRIATQMIIWEYEQQVRTSATTRITNSYGVDKDTYYNIIKDRPAEACYNYILDCISKYYNIPSFLTSSAGSQSSYEMTYDSATNTYSVTLTDTNNTGVDLDFTSENLSVVRNGNKYTFTSRTNSNYSVAAKKKISTTAGPLSLWTGNNTQTMINGASNPLTMYVRLTTPSSSNITILKSSEDNIVSGFKFQIKGTGYDRTYTTDAGGVINVSLPVGTYTIKEIDVPERYNSISSQTITIEAGNSYKINFTNTLKPATVNVTKTSEDDNVEGLWFHLYGTALNGKNVSRYAQTDNTGVATFTNVPLSNANGYTVEEYGTPSIYNTPAAKNVKVISATTYNVAFNNELAKGSVTVKKESEDENISGITFRLTGVSASGIDVNRTASTDATGTAVFDNVPVSGAIPYTVTEELTGSQLNMYYTPDAKTVSVTRNTNSVVNFTNIVKPVHVSVVKTSSDGNVEGIWFKLTGTDVAGNTIVKYAATDATGVAKFADVRPSNAYGYIVTEYFAPTTASLEFISATNGIIASDKQSATIIATTPGNYTVEAYNTVSAPTDHTFNLMIHKEAQDGNVENAQFIAVVFGNDTSYNEFLNTGSTSSAAKAYVLTANSEGIASITNEILKDKAGNLLDPNTDNMHLVVFEVTSTYLNNMLNQYMTAAGASLDEAKAYLETKGFKFVYDYDKYEAGYIVSGGEVTTSKVAAAVLRDGGVYSAHFYNKLNTVDVNLTKTADDNNISGIEFTLTSVTTGETFNGITNENGTISFNNIPIGEYKLSEINPDPNCYEELSTFNVEDESGVNTYNISDTFTITKDITISAHNKVIVSPSYGWLRITKTADDNVISGITFSITGTSDTGDVINETVVTDTTGIASINIPVGTYTVTEINTPSRYITPSAQTVIILKSEITDINTDGTDKGYGVGVTNIIFNNKLKTGSLKITKTSEDNMITGIEFHVFGTSDDGIEVSEYVTTDVNGIAVINNLYPGTYTIEEVNVPIRYEVPADKSIVITANNESLVSFQNILKEDAKYVYKELYYVEVLGEDYDLEINGKRYKLKANEEHDADYEDDVTICNKENLDAFKNYIKVENGTYSYSYSTTIVDSSSILYQFFDLPSYDVNYWLETTDNSGVCINQKYFEKKEDESILNTKVNPLTVIAYGEKNGIVGVTETFNNSTGNVTRTFKTFEGYEYNASVTKNSANPNQGGTATKSNHVIIDLYYTIIVVPEPTTEEPTTEEPTTVEPTTEEPATVEPTTEEPTTIEPTTEEPTTIEPTTEEPTTKVPDINEDVEAGEYFTLYVLLMLIAGITAIALMVSAVKSLKKCKN